MPKKSVSLLVIMLLITSTLTQMPFAAAVGGLKIFSQSTVILKGTEITSHTNSHASDDVWYQANTVPVGVFNSLSVLMIFSAPITDPTSLVQITVFSEAHIKNGTNAGYIRIYNYAKGSYEDCFPVVELSDTNHETTLTANLTDYIYNGEMRLLTWFYGYRQSFFQDYTYIQLTTKPHADFTYTPSIILVNMQVTFNASASYDFDGTIVSYGWDMGDSTIKTGMIITHTYTDMGNFTVTLTVTDNDGLTNIKSVGIWVRNAPPVANFTFAPSAPVVGETVIFNGSLSTPEGGTIISYDWDFGDGNNGTGMIVTHAYGYSDTFNVTLTVVDSEELNATMTKLVTVYTRNIAITSLIPSTEKVYAGYILPIEVGVRNYGNEHQTFNVTVFYGGDNITLETKQVSLEPAEMTTVVFYWNTSTVVYKIPYMLKAEATVLPLETNTTDNTLVNGTIKILMPGDANSDGIVNIRDATMLGLAWMSIVGSPNYNADADFNRDGIVNIKDASVLGSYWGQRAEPTFIVSHIVSWGGQNYRVVSTSNSTVSNVSYNGTLKRLSFDVSGPKGIGGYCAMIIPNSLMPGPWTVLVDGSPVSYSILDPNMHNFTIRFTFSLSTHHVQISGYVSPLGSLFASMNDSYAEMSAVTREAFTQTT